VAVLWPARLAGALDGAPLDTRADALVIGLALPALLAIHPRVTRGTAMRAMIVALLVWKSLLAATTTADGWCLRFTSPVPLFIDNVLVPHAWDVRADWRSEPPRCSAVMTRAYRSTLEFPVWFFNLPPATLQQPADETERPPYATLDITLSGYLQVPADGSFAVAVADDLRLSATIDGRAVDAAELAAGVALRAGMHDISLAGTLTGERWLLIPTWNGRVVWDSAIATMAAPAAVDGWLRPWARWVSTSLVGMMLAIGARDVLLRARNGTAIAAALTQIGIASATAGRTMLMRMVPVLLAVAVALKLPRRLQNMFGAQLLLGLPFLAMVAARGLEDIGRVTWYTIGDDWWLFQRFAYRIYLQGYWLEAGEPAFWFQPFYRWIAGALHLVFGDSSVGELFWDGACVMMGALFAFHVTRVTAGFRWGVMAAALTLALFTLGPGWYLFGRGLSEITSAGLTYAAALLVLRGRNAHLISLSIAGVCVALAFYTRLNNLPFVVAVAAFSLPLRQPAGEWRSWRRWWPRCSPSALAAVTIAVVLAIVLFSLRSYYFTGNPNPLAGTQAGARSVWQTTDEGLTPAQNLVGSLLMVLSMSDPPRLEPRAIPIVTGIAVALLALAGVRRFRALPLNVVVLCVAGITGAFVARGSAYPGRFSIHLIPVTVALTVSAVALWLRKPHDGARA